MSLTDALHEHLADSAAAIRSVATETDRIERWAGDIAGVLLGGGRLLAAGNGGSAAEAQHLTAELVGRYRSERRALSAFPLHADTSTVTAVGNDYGAETVFARQVEAHGRPGDVLVLLSTSGRSPNLLAAADAGRRGGLQVLGLTGPGPTPLGDVCDDTLAVASPRSACVQEVHLVVVHLLCHAVDEAVAAAPIVAAAGLGG